MKLWDSLLACLMLLSVVPSAAGRPSVRIRLSVSSPGLSPGEPPGSDEALEQGDTYKMEEFHPSEFEDVVDFIKVTISRIRRSSSSALSSSTSSSSSSSPPAKLSGTRHRRERKKGPSQKSGKRGRGGPREGESGKKVRGRGRGGRGHGCGIREMHLNVSDLGLGYRSGEEMIFKYCSGPCRNSETNYDKILYNLIHHGRFSPKDSPHQACCRPIAFDDDLSFLDDSLVYHTVRKHSARKCGCV